MTTWYPSGNFGADTTAMASPLANIAAGNVDALPSYWDMFIGNIPGCLGETSALALLIGGIYLIARKVISPIIPVTYIGTVFVPVSYTHLDVYKRQVLQLFHYHLVCRFSSVF